MGTRGRDEPRPRLLLWRPDPSEALCPALPFARRCDGSLLPSWGVLLRLGPFANRWPQPLVPVSSPPRPSLERCASNAKMQAPPSSGARRQPTMRSYHLRRPSWRPACAPPNAHHVHCERNRPQCPGRCCSKPRLSARNTVLESSKQTAASRPAANRGPRSPQPSTPHCPRLTPSSTLEASELPSSSPILATISIRAPCRLSL
jgi:hypothetical protein